MKNTILNGARDRAERIRRKLTIEEVSDIDELLMLIEVMEPDRRIDPSSRLAQIFGVRL